MSFPRALLGGVFRLPPKKLVSGAQPEPPQIPIISLDPGNVALAEGNAGTTNFNFSVSRTGDLTGTSQVTWAVGSSLHTGVSADPSDFVGGAYPSGVLVFAPTESAKTITVQVATDTLQENDEGFVVTLSNPVNATIVQGSRQGTIQNDDDPPPSLVREGLIFEQDFATWSLGAVPDDTIFSREVNNVQNADAEAIYPAGLPQVVDFGGRRWMKHSVHHYTPNSPPYGFRCELVPLGLPTDQFQGGYMQYMSTEAWFGFSVYLPSAADGEDWFDRSEEVLCQFHAVPFALKGPGVMLSPTPNGPGAASGSSPYIRLALPNGGGGVDYVSLGSASPYLGKVTTVVVRLRPSAGGDGIFEIWLDGQLKHSRVNRANCDPGTTHTYFKFGIYRWDWWDIATDSGADYRTRYYDEVRIARGALATFDSVDPNFVGGGGGGGSGSTALRFFLDSAASGIGGFNAWREVPSGTPSDIGQTPNPASSEQLLGTFISQRIPAGGKVFDGTVQFGAHGNWVQGAASAINAPRLRQKLYHRTTGGVETLIGTYDCPTQVSTSWSLMTWSGSLSSVAFAEDERWVSRLYLIPNGANAMGGDWVSLDVGSAGGTGDEAYVEFPQAPNFKTGV